MKQADESKRMVLEALAHRQPPRVAVDLGATAVTGIHASAVQALREHYGLEKRLVKVHEPYQMLGLVEDDLKDALGVDVDGIFPLDTMFGFSCEGWREIRMPWGQEVLVPGGFVVSPAPNGGWHIYPQGDKDAPPSAHLPEGGYFFDSIIRQEPVDEDALNPEDNMEEFAPLSDAALRHFSSEAGRVRAGGRAVVATFPGLAFGDVALVPAPWMKRPKGIRDISEWYVTTASRPDYVHAVFEHQCQMALRNLARLKEVVGDAVDAVYVCGTDFGTQTSQFCSRQTYRELYMPYYQRVNGWIHANTGWKTMKHSCGAVRPLMEDFIESGFDIINPVQCSATGMEPGALKKDFGDRLTFWGGGINTQKTLPFGTPTEVRLETLERCRIFAAGGGFVFNPIHNIQARTPVPNIVAMFDAVREFNQKG